MKLRRKAQWGLIAGAILVVGVVVTTGFKRFGIKSVPVPTTLVQRGAVELRVVANGELRTPHTATLVAPPVSGTLQIVKLLRSGTPVKKDDVVVEFDPGEQEYNLEQAQSQLREAEQQIIKSKADAAVQAAQDKVDLLKAAFDVRRAELEVQKNELLSEIDARKNTLALDEARRRGAQLQQDVNSRQISNEAGIAVLEQKAQQARLSMQQAQTSIQNMVIKAPMDGVVSVKENQDASGGFFYTGMILPEYHEGDQVWPGRFIADVLDLRQLELVGRIDETDRPNVTPGSAVDVIVNTERKRQYSGKVRSVAGLASRRMWGADTVRTFDATVDISSIDPQLRPGSTAEVVIHGVSLRDQLYVPRACVFQRDGTPVLYVREGSGFKAQPIKVTSQTVALAIIEGVAQGTEVALLDPTAKPGSPGKSGAKPRPAGSKP
jgi:multidrug resistance efflux pump